ncbi:jupiter microtubule associated homolog 1-like [Hippopotamus amphibius kiboko]|uniref:jupiter microtubule associated homolog 1-like n=1 Tax=Hippopotamus amphibius kiboko TaxID=575201 RepID=UPI0025954272|nr:jupiter microtubule associated homolog 1-like [Hippopotamus amphibius kiboko]
MAEPLLSSRPRLRGSPSQQLPGSRAPLLCQPTLLLGATTTTTTFRGVNLNSRNSSQVLWPPGGRSNFSLGFDEPTEQPVRRNKMASNIFGTPENAPSWGKLAGATSSGGREDSKPPGPQGRNSSEANSGDFLDLKGEGDVHENMDTDLQASLGQSKEKPMPVTPVPSPVTPFPVPSQRNPLVASPAGSLYLP